MASGIFNIARGGVNELVNQVALSTHELVVVLLKTTESDDLLQERTNLTEILQAAGNTEADFTNYSRKVLTTTEINAPTIDNGDDSRSSFVPDIEWADAGGSLNNSLVKLIICQRPLNQTSTVTTVPLCQYDFIGTTNGTLLTAKAPATGFFKAS